MSEPDRDSESVQRDRIKRLVAEMFPRAEVVIRVEAGMIQYRIDDRTSGKRIATSGYDYPDVIADWSDDDLRRRVTALVAGKA